MHVYSNFCKISSLGKNRYARILSKCVCIYIVYFNKQKTPTISKHKLISLLRKLVMCAGIELTSVKHRLQAKNKRACKVD